MSWGGALFDLAVVPALLWPRSRVSAYVVLVAFHLATWALFPQLGIFPWLMIGLTLIFFAPDWPRRWFKLPSHGTGAASHPVQSRPWLARAAVVGLALFAVVQLALPLRHLAYPGNVRWTEEGYLFAWRVMLTEKVGFVQYRVQDPETGQAWLVAPGEYLTPLQVERMTYQPDMILQAAHLIADDFAERGHSDVVVNADAFVAFNGRPNARLIDPTADLASIKPGPAPKRWVMQYDTDSATAKYGQRPPAP